MNVTDYRGPYLILQRKDFKNESVYEDIRAFMNKKGEDTKDRIAVPIDEERALITEENEMYKIIQSVRNVKNIVSVRR